jgi:thiosulfate/3-mercaptopyruvate sulfurtransferase
MSKFDGFENPDALVTTSWLADNLDDIQSDDSGYRLAEVDVDTSAFDDGHVPGAVGWDWEEDLCDTECRDIAPKEDFQRLAREAGIDDDTTVLLYGDNNNWFAAWAYWQFKYYGHDDVKLVDGGRKKWLQENRDVTTDVPSFSEGNFTARAPDNSIRAFADYILDHRDRDDLELVDVRSHEEFTGEKLGPEGSDEGAVRGGHIPGAHNIGWGEAVHDDGTFKRADELREIYQSAGVTPEKETVAYCHIGERSSHTWFVLQELLGYPNVRNYDGSWTEWGNRIGTPIEKGEG